MAKEKDEKDDKDTPDTPELTIVTDDPKNLEVAPTGPQIDEDDIPKDLKDKEREKAAKDYDDAQVDDDKDEEDSRLGASEETEAEAERKSQHKSRRQRQKEAERRLKTERDYLEKRNEGLEKELLTLKKRMDSGDRANLEARIAHTKTQIARAEKIHAEAVDAKKGEEATEALKLRDTFRDNLAKMEERKVALDKADDEARNPPERPQRPEVAANAGAWIKRTPWFDPNLRDLDSKIVRAIDISVEEDGFDAGTPEYFEELDRRIADRLPHRAKKGGKPKRQDEEDEDIEDQDDEDERPQRRQAAKPNGAKKPSGGPRFRTGQGGRELKSNEVYLSPDRIAAMKEVGAWDDPKLRQKYLKKFQDWDREHADELNR